MCSTTHSRQWLRTSTRAPKARPWAGHRGSVDRTAPPSTTEGVPATVPHVKPLPCVTGEEQKHKKVSPRTNHALGDHGGPSRHLPGLQSPQYPQPGFAAFHRHLPRRKTPRHADLYPPSPRKVQLKWKNHVQHHTQPPVAQNFDQGTQGTSLGRPQGQCGPHGPAIDHRGCPCHCASC